MQAISECFEEHHKRWSKVGQLCGITMTSPVSKSPPGTRPAGEASPEVPPLQDVASNLRFSQHSSFVHNRSMSELVHSPLYQHSHFSSQSQINPVMRKYHSLPVSKGSSRLQFPRLEKRMTLPTIPQVEDMRTDRALTDSMGSASSSGSPAPNLPATMARPNLSRGMEDLEDTLQRSLGSSLERGSREGSRESSVVDGGGGLELVPEQKKTQSSPRNPLRKRTKHNVISSNV